MANTNFGSYTPQAQEHLIQTDPASTQTIAGSLNVTGTLTAGSTINAGTYTGDLEITGSLDVDTNINCDGNLVLDGTALLSGAVTASAAVGFAAAGFTMAAIARTATVAGATTGTIASGPVIQFITVTCDDANKIIILPAPTPGSLLFISVAATGFELRTSDPATIGINGGTGANAESAIPANTTCLLYCATATSWKGLQMGSDGTLAQVEAAA